MLLASTCQSTGERKNGNKTMKERSKKGVMREAESSRYVS